MYTGVTVNTQAYPNEVKEEIKQTFPDPEIFQSAT
jgi:hypothetical protein